MFKSWWGHQKYSLVAQSVERLTVNQNVPGSSPGEGAKHPVKYFLTTNQQSSIIESIKKLSGVRSTDRT